MSRGLSARAWFYGPLGFGSTPGSFPVTSETVRKTDEMLARSDKGLCVDCGGPKDDEGLCAACREDC